MAQVAEYRWVWTVPDRHPVVPESWEERARVMTDVRAYVRTHRAPVVRLSAPATPVPGTWAARSAPQAA